jgi:hypothetical protein
VFNPPYPDPSLKKWEDIIPPFSYTDGATGTKFFPGRNWAAGKDIYYGFGDKAGLCSSSGAKEFALDEYNEWLNDFEEPPNNGQMTSKRQEIIRDLKDQRNIDDGNLSGFTSDFEGLPETPRKPRGPDRPQEFRNLIADLEEYNTTPTPPAKINQALAGVVWKDLNENGVQDAGEEVFGNLGIQIIDPDTRDPLTPEQLGSLSQVAPASSNSFDQPLFSFAQLPNGNTTFSAAVTVISVTTDENGYFEIPSLPEGDWQVNVVTPDGWSYTYDSSGSGDGQMPGTYVPSGGAGFAWAGLVFVGSIPGDTEPTPSLSNTGLDPSWLIISVSLITLAGAGLLIFGFRRTEEEHETSFDGY